MWDQCCRGWKNTENDQDTDRSYSSLGLVHINVKLIIHCTYLYLFCVVSSKIINMKRDDNKIMMHEYINQLNCKSRYHISSHFTAFCMLKIRGDKSFYQWMLAEFSTKGLLLSICLTLCLFLFLIYFSFTSTKTE